MPKFTIKVDDQDALDAIDSEISRISLATSNPAMTREDYLSDFVTTQHANMREPQLRAAAMAKVDDDPPLKALLDKKRAKAEAEEAARLAAAITLSTAPVVTR